ncbi:MAG: hypothetical protein AAGD18_13275 [Actinomycetota bacterium]
MNIRKPLIAGVALTGLVIGGAGVAAAERGSDSEADAEDTASALDVQLENEDGTDDGRDGDRGRRGRGARFSTAAEAIGITVEDLRAELQTGATVADVAEANGVDVQDVIDAMVAGVEERLEMKVQDGRLTEEEAAERLEDKTERITDRVNGVEDEGGDEA